MDSLLAADPIARHILESLVTLERAAGVRAHYRIIDAPPLTTLDETTIQTAARVLSDWIGLRNANFEISVINQEAPPKVYRPDPDQQDFILEISSRDIASAETALAAVTRLVARAYLVNTNIAGSSTNPERSLGNLTDITAIFLGMGKLILNAPATGNAQETPAAGSPLDKQTLNLRYLAFTHRLVCAMRGLDWAQHTTGLHSAAISALKKWDEYRDSVFSQALRNVLTASASHRPLMDAVEDNQLALSRFDQLQRLIDAVVVKPLAVEMEAYHRTCREGMEKLTEREQDTYDPCLLYLNQLRRRMDLQRYADMLQLQQDHIVNRLRVITAGLADLNARDLVHPDHAAGKMNVTHCPFDGTPLTLDGTRDSRVKCPRCGYNFLATPGVPDIAAIKPHPKPDASAAQAPTAPSTGSKKADKTSAAVTASIDKPAASKKRRGAGLMSFGFALLPLGWLPVIGYGVYTAMNGLPAPLMPLLGQVGMGATAAGVVLFIVGLILWLVSKPKPAASDPQAPAEASAADAKTEEKPAA